MPMFTLTVLLMRMGTRNKMGDSYTLEKGMELLILTTRVGLNCYDSPIKELLNKSLEITKFLKHFIFSFQEIHPCEFTEIINETDIIFISSKILRGRAPNIRKNKFKRKMRYAG